jgi:hypothetical protein
VVYKTENQIKMILGINTWRNLLNEKLARFTEMMPQMEQEVLTDLLGQLPQFWLLARNTLDHLEKLTITAQAPIEPVDMREIRKVINYELEPERADPVEQQYLIETVVQNLITHIDMSQQDRAFLSGLAEASSVSARLKIIAALSYVGGRMI